LANTSESLPNRSKRAKEINEFSLGWRPVGDGRLSSHNSLIYRCVIRLLLLRKVAAFRGRIQGRIPHGTRGGCPEGASREPVGFAVVGTDRHDRPMAPAMSAFRSRTVLKRDEERVAVLTLSRL
jgi:hypothetical protein